MARQSHLKSTQARDEILRWIREGRLAPGGRLPSERELAIELSIAHQTVRRGLAELVEAGVVVKRPRVGNFLREAPPVEMITKVALLLPDWTLLSTTQHPLIPLIYKGISRVLSGDDYAILTHWFHRDRFWKDAGRLIADRGVRGAICWPWHSETDADDTRRVLDSGVKFVLLSHSRTLEKLGLVSISIDHRNTLRKLLEGLIERGHRRIFVFDYEPASALTPTREVIQEFADRHLLDDASSVFRAIPSDSYHGQYDAMNVIFDSNPRPTAVIVPDEFVASALLRMCHERGLKVPQDLSIAAVIDNTPHAHPVPITAPDTVSLQMEAAEKAASHLLDELRGNRSRVSRIDLHGDIQWKESVASH